MRDIDELEWQEGPPDSEGWWFIMHPPEPGEAPAPLAVEYILDPAWGSLAALSGYGGHQPHRWSKERICAPLPEVRPMPNGYIPQVGRLVGCLFVLESLVAALLVVELDMVLGESFAVEHAHLSYTMRGAGDSVLIVGVDIDANQVFLEGYKCYEGPHSEPDMAFTYEQDIGWHDHAADTNHRGRGTYAILAQAADQFHEQFMEG